MTGHTSVSEPCATCGSDPGGLAFDERIATIVVSILLFGACFVAAWIYFERLAFFKRKPLAIQADLCSRVHSTVHSVIVVPGLLWCLLSTRWDDQYSPLTTVAPTQVLLLVSVGYFLFDLVVTVWYRLPQWHVYAVHHVAAVTPYVVYMFVARCQVGIFILAAFLLVEATNVPLNVQAFLEQSGRGDSPLYAAMVYTTLVGWVVFRIANPLMLLYVIHAHVYPNAPHKQCLWFSMVCAYFIAFFCVAVFFTILVPEVLNRWRSTPEVTSVAKEPRESKALRVNPDFPLDDDELELTAQSPTRIALYDVRDTAHQFENAVNQAVHSGFEAVPNATGGLRRTKSGVTTPADAL